METLGLSDLAEKPVGKVEWGGKDYDIQPIKLKTYVDALSGRESIGDADTVEGQVEGLLAIAEQLGPGLPAEMFTIDALNLAQLQELIGYLDKAQSKQLGASDSKNPPGADTVQ
jgi:hypothetical protein